MLRGLAIKALTSGLAWAMAPTPAIASTEGSHFVCAGSSAGVVSPVGSAAKPVAFSTVGTRRAIALFATFAETDPPSSSPPDWSSDLFDPALPGSFSHFYDTMSFGKLQVRGQVAARTYASAHPAEHYVSADPTQEGRFGAFCQEILEQADADIDFSQYDSDGPDGIANSGDDDGVVDALFIVVGRMPHGFILGRATGVGNLGLAADFEADDISAAGVPIAVQASEGAILRGPTYAEAVGTMCHEYGHVLGLPDLYNTAYLRQADRRPEEDSAGIGAWGLMGWGALGWNGHDGPNSLCAWSRVRLGWTEAEIPSPSHQEVSLTAAGRGGSVLQIPIGLGEYFLLECRTRQACYYDRAIPGEGLLVWHARLVLGESGGEPSGWEVDLECADGRWRDKGYPEGRAPAPADGEDNLDFWAHDAEYAAIHVGNVGDATDPFDGVTYTTFAPETNPSAAAADGATPVRFDSIRRVGEAMAFTVTMPPPLVEVRQLALDDEFGDGAVHPGELVHVTYGLVNAGVLPVRDVRVRLDSSDPLVQIETSETRHGNLQLGEESLGGGGDGFPSFRLSTDFAGTHEVRLALSVIHNGQVAVEREVDLTAYSPREQVASVAIIDTLGNSDGHVQPGEPFSVELALEATDPSLLRPYSFQLRALESTVGALGSPVVVFDWINGRMVSVVSPTFLAPASAQAGDVLGLGFETRGASVVWSDTLDVAIAAGRDATRPIVRMVAATPFGGGCQIMVPARQVYEGGEVHGAIAHILDAADSTLVDVTELQWSEWMWEGTWLSDVPGQFLVQALLTDQNGNQGRSPIRRFHISPSHSGLPPGYGLLGRPWELLALSARTVDFNRLLYHPLDPRIVFGVSQQAVWQSSDGGRTWQNLGIMLHDDSDVHLDPTEPSTLYVEPRTSDTAILRTHDGGRTWRHLERPHASFRILCADPERSGRLYGGSWGGLMASDDYGDSWFTMREGPAGLVMVSRGPPKTIYATQRAPASWGGSMGSLRRSGNDGETWEGCRLPPQANRVYLDPHSPFGIYATAATGDVYYSPDRGDHWESRSGPPSGPPSWSRDAGLSPSPAQQGLLYAWANGSGGVARSVDGGRSWQRLSLPDGVRGGVFYPHPLKPLEGYCLYSYWRSGGAKAGLLHTGDLQTWQRVPVSQMEPPTGAFAVDGQRRLYIGSGRREPGQRGQAQVLRSDGAGEWTPLSACPGPSIDPSFTPVVETLLAMGGEPGGLIAHSKLGPDGDAWVTRSLDGGETWARVPIDNSGRQASHSVITGHPSRPATVYVADYWTGLWRSLDRGRTWMGLMKMSDTSGYNCAADNGFGPLNAVAMDGVVADVLYAASADGTCSEPQDDHLWVSRDAGDSWHDIGPVPGGTTLQCLAHHPLLPHHLYALAPDALYLSSDGAQSWTLLSRIEGPGERGVRRRLRFHPSDPDRMFVVTGPRLLATADGGLTWQSVGEGVAAAPWFEDVACDPLHPDVVYAATPWGVYQSRFTETGTAVEGPDVRPLSTSLAQNHPNPFNGSTTIRFALAEQEDVSLSIYNLAGQKVATLTTGRREAGSHSLRWDGRGEGGQELASGVYLCRLQAGGQVETRKLLLLR